ncbi:MAG: helix-turn-helix domain-containing protein [Arenicellales bacterium]
MTSFPLHRVATVLPFINYLRQQNVPIEKELIRVKLPVAAIIDPDCFIPSKNYWNFIANVAERERTKDMGFYVGLKSGANAADLGMSKRLLQLPTLKQALVQFCKIASSEISQVSLWLEAKETNTHRLYYQTSYGREHPAYVHFQWYGLMAAIAAIRLFHGKHWNPTEIGLGSIKNPSVKIHEYFPNTQFITGQPVCFITLSNSLLGNPLQPDKNLFENSIFYSRIKAPCDYIGALKLVLRSYLRDKAPPLELAAAITGQSTRTLQRQLASKGLTYRELLTAVRFETAIELMQNTDMKIADISSQLSYADPTNFTRSFRQIAGVSPREYMRQLVR